MRCEEKQRYRSRAEAKRKRNKSALAQHIKLYVYKCTLCGFFHLTKNRIGNTHFIETPN